MVPFFWESFIQATCLPHNCGCEHIHLEAWIRQPVNFLSSIAFILVGIRLCFLSITFHQRFWSLLCVLLGVSSHLAHASFIQLFMSMDFTSIITLMLYPPLALLTKEKSRRTHLGLVVVSSVLVFVLMFYSPKWVKIFGCFAFFFLILLYHMKFMRQAKLRVSVILLGIGTLFFILDETRVLCDPHSWFQFHSLWHIFTALALLVYGKWLIHSGRW